jgi:hypothetical protein
MKRHLIWIIAGTAAIGLAVPAFAAVQPAATPDDNGVPGDVRGNCDEAEHANDAECLTVTIPAAPAATPTTTQITAPSTSAPANTVPSNTVPGNTVPSNTVAGNTVPSNTVAGTVPDNTVANSLPGDISGPCDEAEHANDSRCTGSSPTVGDNSGPGSDDSGHDNDDDNSGHDGGDDDSSGHGGDDDSSGHGGNDD